MNRSALTELKSNLLDKYSQEIEKIYLFGSQAKGSATEDSDYDIFILVKNDFDWRFENQIIDECYEIDLKYNLITDVKMMSVSDLSTVRGKQPYVQEALNYGVAL